MKTIQIRSHVGTDGVLRLEVPGDFRNRDIEVVVVLQTVSESEANATPDDLGWPPGFLERTYGSIQDETFKRWPQGEYEEREPIA